MAQDGIGRNYTTAVLLTIAETLKQAFESNVDVSRDGARTVFRVVDAGLELAVSHDYVAGVANRKGVPAPVSLSSAINAMKTAPSGKIAFLSATGETNYVDANR